MWYDNNERQKIKAEGSEADLKAGIVRRHFI
jgi:hypothetical protein